MEMPEDLGSREKLFIQIKDLQNRIIIPSTSVTRAAIGRILRVSYCLSATTNPFRLGVHQLCVVFVDW
jgi:hypothetical protein